MENKMKNYYGKCCSAIGCSMRPYTNLLSQVKMFQFPKDKMRRAQWVNAMKRENWQPYSGSVICNAHFLTGKPNSDPLHPDYIPSIFNHHKGKTSSKNSLARYERHNKRMKTDSSPISGSKGKPNSDPLQINNKLSILNHKKDESSKNSAIPFESYAKQMKSDSSKLHQEYCCVSGCTNMNNSNLKPGVTFHQFPANNARKLQWLLGTKRKIWELTPYSRVCSEHFSNDMFCKYTKVPVLNNHAVPILFKKSSVDNKKVQMEGIGEFPPPCEKIGESIQEDHSETVLPVIVSVSTYAETDYLHNENALNYNKEITGKNASNFDHEVNSKNSSNSCEGINGVNTSDSGGELNGENASNCCNELDGENASNSCDELDGENATISSSEVNTENASNHGDEINSKNVSNFNEKISNENASNSDDEILSESLHTDDDSKEVLKRKLKNMVALYKRKQNSEKQKLKNLTILYERTHKKLKMCKKDCSQYVRQIISLEKTIEDLKQINLINSVFDI